MKWFKHITTSLEDPFIFDLIDRFGGDGYLVYFGTVEVMAREFDENMPGFCTLSERFLAKKLQLSRHKMVKILKYCNEKQKIFVEFSGENIKLNCPKLKEFCDDWTQRKLRSDSVVAPKKHHIEEEGEEEGEGGGEEEEEEADERQPDTGQENSEPDEIVHDEVCEASTGNGKLTPASLAGLWNRLKPPSLPSVILPINSKRIKKAQLALRTRADPKFWESLIRSMADAPFLLGANDRGWKADFDFILEKYDRIFEGKYLTETRVSATTIKNMQAGKEWLAEDRKYG